MKFYFILFVFAFLLKSNNHIAPKLWLCNAEKIYTLIEDNVSQKDTHWLHLLDVSGTKICTLQNVFELLDSAYHFAIPLEFTCIKQHILAVRLLSNVEKTKFFKAFTRVPFYKLTQLTPNLDGKLIQKVGDAKAFQGYLMQQFQQLNLKNLNIGCEARAGIIAKYLNDQSNLNHYKIFINGQLKLKTKINTYTWAHHVLNVIPIKQKNNVKLYVFDPFILGGLYLFDDFLKQLENSGSSRFDYRITDANVFVCLMQQPIGIIDEENHYSKTIFQQLYMH